MSKYVLLATTVLGIFLFTAFPVSAETETSPSPTPKVRQEVVKKNISQNSDALQEFRKKQETEYAEKVKVIKEKRLSCGKQISTFVKERAQARQDLVKGCKPADGLTKPTKSEDMKKYREIIKARTQECKDERTTFDAETKTKRQEIQTNCKLDEFKVLGISTSVQ